MIGGDRREKGVRGVIVGEGGDRGDGGRREGFIWW